MVLQLTPDRQRITVEQSTEQLLLCQTDRQLDEGQRAATRRDCHSTRHFAVDRPLRALGQELQRRIFGQTADVQGRQPVEHTHDHLKITHREQQRDAVRFQPARYKAHRLEGLTIHPLRIVDDAQQPTILHRVGEQAQRRQADQEPVRWRLVPQAKGRFERGTLGLRQVLSPRQQRAQQSVQARIAELTLGLHTHDPEPR